MRFLTAAVLGVLAFPQEPPASLPALEKRVTIDRTAPFKELLDLLRNSSGVNVVLDPRIHERLDPAARREVLLRNVKASSALRWITSLFGLDFTVRDGVAFVSERRYLEPPVIRSYDVHSYRPPARDRPGGQLALSTPERVGFQRTLNEPADSELGDTVLLDLIKENVVPGTWDGPRAIEAAPEFQLVVNQTPSAHKELAWFLEALSSFAPPTVSVVAEIADAPESEPDLLALNAPLVIAPGGVDALARRAIQGKARRLEIRGLNLQRVHSATTQESSGITGYMKGNPLLTDWISEAGILDVRPTLEAGGRSLILELHLSAGQSRDLEAVKTTAGSLPRQERTLTLLATTFRIPNGGAVLFSLPARNGRPQLCLLRASTSPAPSAPHATARHSPLAHDPGDVAARLKDAPPADVALSNAPFADFAAWLRTSAGLNVVVHPNALEKRVSVECRQVAPAGLLPLVLEPLGLRAAVRDEALYLTSENDTPLQTSILDVRDLSYGLQDFPAPAEEAPRQQFTGEDLANLIKNTIHRNRWEEADGHSIQLHDNLLILRNTPDVLKDCIAWIEDYRRAPRRTVNLQADLITLPAAAVDELLGAAKDGPSPIDAAVYDRLLSRGRSERLAWPCFSGQRTSMAWGRALDYLHDYTFDEDPVLRSHPTLSSLDLRPTIEKGGDQIRIDLRYDEIRIVELKETAIKDRIKVQTPVTEATSAKSTFALSPDRPVVLRWGLPAREGKERQDRLLILKAGLPADR